jgi:acyl-CoA thioesterase-2
VSANLQSLVELLTLEPIEQNLYRGQTEDLGWGRLYGGHVLAQALVAAANTAPPDRGVHSLHAYFLKPGDVSRPIIYDVDRIREGGTFTTRRVVAIQNGHAIFNLAVSFKIDEGGFSHQDQMPEVPSPESLKSDQERARAFADRLPGVLRERALAEQPFEFRMVSPILHEPFNPEPHPPHRMLWLRANGKVADDPALHRALLAYVSDFHFVTTALLPHGVGWLSPGLQIASIDHVMWFYDAFRVDDWLLYVMDSPVARGGRGLAHGRVFTRDGRLVVASAQEGLMRKRDAAKA